ncbi:hypothetical protein [Yinghuangia soli]|uniref:Uncharacterized protein n=1 Tax=Yinghuangia soli TaxID=2908204 RepID=A0AA41Q4A5_9ACTN|nr:hypothetical protein [Yinghuangia soli]MCF2529842.1 hypothetical protein [Yinghuangia soli]
MQLEQLIWGVTALGALAAGAAFALLAFARTRVRETGVVVAVLLAGLMFCAGGFLLSTPRYAYTALIAGGAAAVGVMVGLVWGRTGAKDRTWQAEHGRAPKNAPGNAPENAPKNARNGAGNSAGRPRQ